MTPELERALKNHKQWFGSYKKSGELAKVQVWLVVNRGRIEFLTNKDSYKVRRVRRNSRAICYVGSKEGPTVAGRAEIVTEKAEQKRVYWTYWKTHPVFMLLGIWLRVGIEMVLGKRVVVRVVPDEPNPLAGVTEWDDHLSPVSELIADHPTLATSGWIVDTPWFMDGSNLRDYATEAIRYWEPRRLFYNLFLVLVVVITFWLNLPSSRAAITIDSILWLFLLAVVANVAYCAAYIVDLFVQASAFRSHWQQFRWLLFALGSAFAGVLARYVSMTLFAAVAGGSK